MLIQRKKYGQSTMEFVALIVIILAAFVVFQKYIVRSISGRWKSTGDALGQGKIFDPHHTIECAASTFFPGNPVRWYNRICFEEQCIDDCLEVTKDAASCDNCLSVTCHAPQCD